MNHINLPYYNHTTIKFFLYSYFVPIHDQCLEDSIFYISRIFHDQWFNYFHDPNNSNEFQKILEDYKKQKERIIRKAFKPIRKDIKKNIRMMIEYKTNHDVMTVIWSYI